MYHVEHRLLQKQLAEYIQTPSSRILKHALSTKRPDGEREHSDPNFENHVCHENPGKRPTPSAKKGVKSKIVF